jgi:photosystem II stability/assembly factor-like uncharacterized protein
MTDKIIAASDQGIIFLKRTQGGWEEDDVQMENRQFTCITAEKSGSVLAGTRNGLFLSLDGGINWQDSNQGLSQLHLRSLAFHPDKPGFAYAGTEPAAIFISKDGGHNWQECLEVARLRDQHDWFLPYSPEAGCIRGFAFSGKDGFAAVEVGGMLASYDFGESWQLTQDQNNLNPPSKNIHADVHRVYIHPKSKNTVLAPTGGGLYLSENGGQEWSKIHPNYCRGAWSDPNYKNTIILGPADGPDKNGRIERTADGGKTWENANMGLDLPWNRTMVEHLIPVSDDLFAVLSNGRLIYASKRELSWQTLLPPVKGVRDLAVLH